MKRFLIISILTAFAISGATARTALQIFKSGEIVNSFDAATIDCTKVEDNGSVKAVNFYSLGIPAYSYNIGEIDYMDVIDLDDGPANLRAESVQNGVSLKWDAVAGNVYDVYRSADGRIYSRIASAVNENEYLDTAPSKGTCHYRVSASKGEVSTDLSEPVKVDVTISGISLDIPDKDGYNVKGVVYCGDTPVEGVVVSDGTNVATTDAYGRYYLNSDKTRSYVFVSVPGGYNVKNDKNFPKFYSRFSISDASVIEQHNFELFKNDNTDYVVIGLADMHVANIRDTPRQFTERFIPDVNATIAGYKAQGKDVYCISLGDETHDLYWYDYNLALGAAKPYFEMIDAPLFHCMGNHDNDPYYPGDFIAENTWRNEIGPSYYSFNIGNIHYVVLDNIVYRNEGASIGTLGDRSYDERITDNQIEWLKKDLAMVPKTTPLVVCMHCRYFKKAILSGSSQVTSVGYSLENYGDLKPCLNTYSNVTILTGHAHTNSSTELKPIREYNIGAVNGSLWYTGQDHMAKNHICADGSVGGYFVMEVNGTTYTNYYKSMGYDRNYQFRTYDGNETFIRKSVFFPNSTRSNKKAYDLFESKVPGCMEEWGGVYADGATTPKARTDNKVFINVFAFDNRWKIKVTEEGKELKVTRINAFDPLHIASNACQCLNNGENKDRAENITSGRLPSKTSHFFTVQASSKTSTLFIEVTDPYGNVYTEEMTRPKKFTLDMR